METLVGDFLYVGEVDETYRLYSARVRRELEKYGDIHVERLKLQWLQAGMNLLLYAIKLEARRGILTDAIPVYNLGIVDPPPYPYGVEALSADDLESRIDIPGPGSDL